MSVSLEPRIERAHADLSVLAYNLRWSWEPTVVELFRALAPEVWDASHNPVAVLNHAAESALAAYADELAAARAELEAYLNSPPRAELGSDPPRVAYLSMEFAIAECLQIYSGGLGVLAGDHLKAASDLGLPLTGIGLFYRYGYFRQVIDNSGWQREQYDRQEPESLPLRRVVDPSSPTGAPLRVPVPFPGRTVLAQVWCAQVGRVPLYLLDTDLPENREDDRWISGHLYGGDQDTRIRQELVLGVGGGRVLRALGTPLDVYHLNEGHAAFLALELAHQRMLDGSARTFHEAGALVAPQIAFTTHTPVAAGHDTFPGDLMEAYFAGYRGELGLSREELLALGRERVDDPTEAFSMTVLALRSAARRNAVSQLHGVVSREMWGHAGVGVQDTPPAEPMAAITNGVHTATWVGPEMAALFDAQLGRAWRDRPDDPSAWEALNQVRPIDLWTARTEQRARLLSHADELSREAGHGGLAPDVMADPSRTLVLGFARRFATYKRASLLLQDPERLERLLNNPQRPVVLLFAGKAHPRDEPGKALMQRIVEAARHDGRFRGRLVFLENYDVRLARYLVQGSDVWLNTPRRPMEASGTSGMKATLNGAQHFSELDGWWDEAYRPDLGWALGKDVPDTLSTEAVDAAEAIQLIEQLEREVVPTYFDREGEAALPLRWLQRVVTSVSALSPFFSTHRMVLEYVQRVYVPAAETAAVAMRNGRDASASRHDGVPAAVVQQRS